MALRTTLTTLFLFSTALAAKPQQHPHATIDAGVVVGTTTSLPTATAPVNQFLGIPFAQSPPERFAPLQSPGTFRKPIQATKWKPACIQQFALDTISVESEDCL